MKYLLLGAFSTGFLIYGFSLLYGIAGATNLTEVARALGVRGRSDPVVLLAFITTAVGLLFKIAAVPFHMWAPDAYEGAPTPVTGYLSVASKAAAFAFLLRIFLGPFDYLRPVWEPMFVAVAAATLTLGNLAALTQSNVKRMLAYSSIAHAGYMLLGLIAGNATGIKGVAVYILVYTFMNAGAFIVLALLRRESGFSENLDDLAGLGRKHPVHAIWMLVFLISLAGLPPTAGFIGKYYIFLSLVEAERYVLAVIAVLYVAVSVYFYFRIVRAMFFTAETSAATAVPDPANRLALGLSGVATLLIGLYPEPFLRFAEVLSGR